MRKRILFALPAKDFGGCERVTMNLLRHIDREQFEPHLTMLEPDGMPVGDLLASVGIHNIGVRRARWAALPIAKLCWTFKFDVIFSMSAHLNAVILASRPLLPRGTALVVYESADLTSPEMAPGPLRSVVYRQAYQRADLVICQSECMRHDLLREFGLAPSKTLRIYNPVDVEAITALADAEPNPFSGAGPNLVAVGRMSHEKGFDILLRALPLILVAVPNVSLTVVGQGPDLPGLKAAQQQLGLESVVRFVGPRRNPFPFLKHADLLVLPSRSDAMPNVLLEAIALGTPAVTTNCSGALCELKSYTQRLLVAQNRTPEALAKEVISALSVARAKPAVVEPQFEAQFGARAVLKQYERAFLESLSARISRLVAAAA